MDSQGTAFSFESSTRAPSTFYFGEKNRFRLQDKIGKGATAEVYKCLDINTNTPYAIKIFNFASGGDEAHREHIKTEMLTLKKFNHPNIVHMEELVNISLDNRNESPALIMEYLPEGELFTYIRNGQLSENSIKFIFAQVVDALHHIHSRGIIHRDLKAENVLVKSIQKSPYKDVFGNVIEQRINICIGDFGLSKALVEYNESINCPTSIHMENSGLSRCTNHNKCMANDPLNRPLIKTANTVIGTPQYWAPEIVTSEIFGSGYDFSVDLWSLGILLYVMIGICYPFPDSALQLHEMRAPLKFRSPRFDKFSDSVKKLLKELIVFDPEKRLNLIQVIENEWLENFEKSMDVAERFVSEKLPYIMPANEEEGTKEVENEQIESTNSTKTETIGEESSTNLKVDTQNNTNDDNAIIDSTRNDSASLNNTTSINNNIPIDHNTSINNTSTNNNTESKSYTDTNSLKNITLIDNIIDSEFELEHLMRSQLTLFKSLQFCELSLRHYSTSPCRNYVKSNHPQSRKSRALDQLSTIISELRDVQSYAIKVVTKYATTANQVNALLDDVLEIVSIGEGESAVNLLEDNVKKWSGGLEDESRFLQNKYKSSQLVIDEIIDVFHESLFQHNKNESENANNYNGIGVADYVKILNHDVGEMGENIKKPVNEELLQMSDESIKFGSVDSSTRPSTDYTDQRENDENKQDFFVLQKGNPSPKYNESDVNDIVGILGQNNLESIDFAFLCPGYVPRSYFKYRALENEDKVDKMDTIEEEGEYENNSYIENNENNNYTNNENNNNNENNKNENNNNYTNNENNNSDYTNNNYTSQLQNTNDKTTSNPPSTEITPVGPQTALQYSSNKNYSNCHSIYVNLIRSMHELRNVNRILHKSFLFWHNVDGCLSRMAQAKEHASSLLTIVGKSPKVFSIFEKRLLEYQNFWKTLALLCTKYASKMQLNLQQMMQSLDRNALVADVFEVKQRGI